jgi:4-amino-4-deoxy-L-arabinose transferase-like glycosyltransferase
MILGFTLLRIALAAVLPLTPQEAYYWLWSRELAWSYFDHPPLASYSIALTTALLGSTSFGIKMAAVVWSLGLNVVWARLILDLGSNRRQLLWSLLALNLVGIIEAYGVVIAPDAPLLFAWGATLWATWRAVATGNGRWWLAAGIFLGLGLLAKYPAVLLAPAIALFLLASKRQRHWLGRPEPYLGLLLAAVVFAPVIMWNAQHDWASFAFQTTQRATGMGRWQPRYLLQMIGTQLVAATPYLLVIAVLAWIAGLRDWRGLLRDDGRLLLMAAATVPLVLFTLTSLRSMVKPNWLAPAYAPLVVLAIRTRVSGDAIPRSLRIGLASSAMLLLAAVLAMTRPGAMIAEADTWGGWPEAARRIDQIQRELAARGEASFVFSTNYKNSALLAFHRAGHPRTYAQGIYGERALQFDFWQPEHLAGATGILAVDDRRNEAAVPEKMKPYFDSITKVESLDIRHGGRATRRIDIYLCSGYRGHPREREAPQ